MVVILVFLTLLVCLAIDYIRTRHAQVESVPGPVAGSIPGSTTVLERYFHPGHSWALLESASLATVGVDEVARGFIGSLDRVEIVPQGTVVRQGEPLVKLHRGTRSLTLVAPLSGVLKETNSRLSAHPSLLGDSPFDKGWVARIIPANLALEIHNLMKGALAERWREGVRAQLASWFAPRLGLVMQDGGQMVDDYSDLLSDKDWRELAASLFLVEASDQSITSTREGL